MSHGKPGAGPVQNGRRDALPASFGGNSRLRGAGGLRNRLPLLLFMALLGWFLARQLLSLPGEPVMEADSASYLRFFPIRTAGYPLFLQWVGAARVPAMQVILFAAAVGYLGFEIRRLTGHFLWAAGALFFIVRERELNVFHAEIMTESLFTSLLVVFLGLVIRSFRQTGWRTLAAASLLAGLATALRPSGYPYLAILVLLALSLRKGAPNPGWALVLAAVLPMVLVVGLERAYTRQHHGANATSLAGRHFFAKGAMIDAPRLSDGETDPLRRRLLQIAEDDFAPVRSLVAEAPDAGIRTHLIPDYETCIEHACMDPFRPRLQREFGLSDAELNEALRQAGLQRIAAAPLGFARLAWTHYRNMWSYFVRYYPQFGPGYRDFIDVHRPLPFEPLVTMLIPESLATPAKIITVQPPRLRPLAIGVLLAGLTVLAFGHAIRGRPASPAFGIAAVAGLTVQAMLLFAAAFAIGIPRYMVVLWPATVVALVVLAWWGWSSWIVPWLCRRWPMLWFALDRCGDDTAADPGSAALAALGTSPLPEPLGGEAGTYRGFSLNPEQNHGQQPRNPV